MVGSRQRRKVAEWKYGHYQETVFLEAHNTLQCCGCLACRCLCYFDGPDDDPMYSLVREKGQQCSQVAPCVL